MATAARSLHSIFEAVQADGGPSLQARWQNTLGADFDSVDFALRHAVVMGLWNDTVRAVLALPASKTRERRLAYAPLWWHAIITPHRAWGEAKQFAIVDQPALDALDMTAEHLEHLDDAPGEPPLAALTQLRIETEAWISRITEIQNIARGLRTSLVEHLQTVVWLIDNSDRFGAAPVVKAAETATGTLVRAGVETDQPKKWGDYIKQFAATTGLVASGLAGVNVVIDQAQHATAEIASVVTEKSDPDPDAASGKAEEQNR